MNYKAFVEEQIASLRETVGDGLSINALSGGVDSSVVTVLGHRSLGKGSRPFSLIMHLCEKASRSGS